MMDWLKNNDDEMSRVETETQKFYKALDAYLSDKETFVLSMKPTKVRLRNVFHVLWEKYHSIIHFL